MPVDIDPGNPHHKPTPNRRIVLIGYKISSYHLRHHLWFFPVILSPAIAYRRVKKCVIGIAEEVIFLNRVVECSDQLDAYRVILNQIP